MSDLGMVRRWAGERPKVAGVGELQCLAEAVSDAKFVCVLARGHAGPHKSAVGVDTELGSSSSVLATWMTRPDGSEVGERRAVVDGRIMSSIATGSGGWGRPSDKIIAKVKAELDGEAKLKRPRRPKQAPQRAAEQLVPCPAEDARGFACSKVAGHDGEHHNVSGWEPEDPEADAAAQAALDAEEDRSASRWGCEALFLGTDDREHKCEARSDHNGPHYAWSVGDRVTIHARAEQPAAKFKQYGFVLQVSDGGVLCHDQQFRELTNPVSALDHEQRPHVFATKQRAGSQAHWLERATKTVSYFVDEAGHEARVGDAPTTGEEKKKMETIDTDSAPHTNGAPKKSAPPKKARRIEMIARDLIEPDPNQPRKTFDDVKLHELAESMKEHHIQVPITVRPKPGKDGSFIIIWGERRWRAAAIAGIDTIPSIVDTDAGDDPAALLERQLIENAQRDDLHPLEEGEALATLHYKEGRSIEDLVTKTGKSRSHVYSRIAMTKLAAGVKKALLDGRLPHAHSGLIGTIPDHKAQEQCCKEVLGELAPQGLRALEDIGVSHESVTDDASRRVVYGDGKPQVLSFRATAALIRRRYQTRLQLATFDPNDATLTTAGACGPCQHNSANQPELPGIAASVKPESHCGNLSCFEKKTQAQFKRVADAAKGQGKKVFEGKKAEAMFSHNGELKPDTGFAAPDQRLPWNLVNSYDDKFTYKKMLGKHLAEVPTAIVQNDRGAPVEVLDIDKAHEILKQHKLLPKKAGTSSSSGKPTAAEKRAKEKQKEEKAAEKLREEAMPYFVAQAGAAAKDLPATKSAALWRLLALFLREFLDYAAGELYRSIHGDDEDPHDHIGKRADKLKDESDLRALVIELLVIQAGDDIASGAGATDEAMALATKLLGLDWKKAEKMALIGREQKKVNEEVEKISEAAKAKRAKKGGGK